MIIFHINPITYEKIRIRKISLYLLVGSLKRLRATNKSLGINRYISHPGMIIANISYNDNFEVRKSFIKTYLKFIQWNQQQKWQDPRL